MKPILLTVLSILSCNLLFSQLTLYPGLPGNHLKSAKYSVNVKLENETNYSNSYVYQYLVNIGSSSNNNIYDPYNISTEAKRNALTNNHWTTLSYNNNGQKLQFEISKAGEAITSCNITPSRYGIQATILDGKAYVTIDTSDTYLYLNINGKDMDPLFLFVDPQEKNVPTASTSTIEYFGPGIHNIGEKYTFPNGKNEIYIAGGAYVKGTIFANGKSNITVRGRGILSGEGYNYRSGASGIPWCAIMFDGSGTNQLVEGITSMKPIHFHILSRGTLKTNNVKCFSYNNTTDGWGGGINSELKMSFFKVNDDVTKLYANNMKLKDIICYHQTNTPIFEFGWGGQQAQNCIVDGLDIIEDRHVNAQQDNGGIIGWASSNGGKVHKGHVFKNVRSDCEVNFIFHMDHKTSDVCEFTCEDWNLKSTRLQSTPISNTKVIFKCVKIGDNYITASEIKPGGTMIFDNSMCQTTNILNATIWENSLHVFPVPFGNRLNVMTTSSTIAIYGIDGQKVYTDIYSINGGFEVKTESLPAGLYFVYDGNSTVKVVKY